jgi:hypothetical protein
MVFVFGAERYHRNRGWRQRLVGDVGLFTTPPMPCRSVEQAPIRGDAPANPYGAILPTA